MAPVSSHRLVFRRREPELVRNALRMAVGSVACILIAVTGAVFVLGLSLWSILPLRTRFQLAFVLPWADPSCQIAVPGAGLCAIVKRGPQAGLEHRDDAERRPGNQAGHAPG